MTGALMATAGASAGATTGSTVIPSPTPAWTSIVGIDDASSNIQTITGIGAPMSIGASVTGSGLLYYTQNGVPYAYSGAFTAHNGDVISWGISTPGTSRVSGTVTVINNSDAGATLCSIPYHVASSGGL